MFARVAAELVETERSYVKSLGTLVELYVRPAASNHILGAARSKRIFQNAEWLLEVNSAFLAALEKACAAEADAPSGRSGAPRGRVLGALLRRFLARATPLYLEYIQNYGTAIKALDDGARRYGAIRNLLEKVRSNPACGGLQLQSFLIMPVQRLPRYKMLFEEMVKAISKEEAASATSAQTDRQAARPEMTSPFDPPSAADASFASSEDREALVAAAKEVDAVTIRINDSVRDAENLTKLLELANSIDVGISKRNTVPPSVISTLATTPHRRFVREGAVSKICRNGPRRYVRRGEQERAGESRGEQGRGEEGGEQKRRKKWREMHAPSRVERREESCMRPAESSLVERCDHCVYYLQYSGVCVCVCACVLLWVCG